MPFAWFTADEAYGQAGYPREWLETRDVFYLLATRCDQQITTRADTLVAEFAASAWQRLSVGAGAHGPREFDWARRQISRWRRRSQYRARLSHYRRRGHPLT